jgi:uncharacterized GH25 family protein
MDGYRYPLDDYYQYKPIYGCAIYEAHNVWIYSKDKQTSGKSHPVELPYNVKTLYDAEQLETLKVKDKKLKWVAIDRTTERVVGVRFS